MFVDNSILEVYADDRFCSHITSLS
jgi:hypothetical protein